MKGYIISMISTNMLVTQSQKDVTVMGVELELELELGGIRRIVWMGCFVDIGLRWRRFLG